LLSRIDFHQPLGRLHMIARTNEYLRQQSAHLWQNRCRPARLDGCYVFVALRHWGQRHRYRLHRHSLHPSPRWRSRRLLAAGHRQPYQYKTTDPKNSFQRANPHSFFPLTRHFPLGSFQSDLRLELESLPCRMPPQLRHLQSDLARMILA
jgi:hypothetical protein